VLFDGTPGLGKRR